MTELRTVDLHPVQMSIEPQTRLLVLKQGDNEVKITRDHVIKMRKLREGTLPNGCFTSLLSPRNRFTMTESGTITIACKDEWEDNTVVIANHKKLDDLQRISEFVDKNKGRIAWEREFKGRY
jgi:hypothetical protein